MSACPKCGSTSMLYSCPLICGKCGIEIPGSGIPILTLEEFRLRHPQWAAAMDRGEMRLETRSE